MSKRRLMAVGLFLLAPVSVGAFLLQGREPLDGARLFAQVLQRIEDSAVDSLSRNALYEKAARGLIKNLRDPYADLYSPEELASFQRNTLRNNYGGLGMQIEPHDDNVVVARVFPGTPAAAGGVQPGDRILQVDSVVTTGLRLDQVSGRLVGRPGTSVEVVFQRQGVPQPIRSKFVRAVIRVPAVPYTLAFDRGVGYIPLQSFNESSADDVERSLADLRQKGARAYILDLRGNGGGSLEQALEISNLFLRNGQEIARVRHRSRSPEVYKANRGSVVDSMPVVVLVDGFSASASEIVAGSLQDHDRALVVGTTSFGKGLVQTLFPIEGGWAIKLTTGKWYTPSGRSIQAEHERLDDDRFVEYAPADSAQRDSARVRPVFRSDAGRSILGGGGVTPDVLVKPDTATTIEREFIKSVGPLSQAWYVTLYNYALEQKASLKPDFTITPAMREEFFQRLHKAKVPVTKPLYDEATELVERSMEEWFTKVVFGDSAWTRRRIKDDRPMQEALDYLRRGVTQRQILTLASEAAKARPQQQQ
ncbi:MAG: S41 family peptidase [Gemmatimonadales bacterium]